MDTDAFVCCRPLQVVAALLHLGNIEFVEPSEQDGGTSEHDASGVQPGSAAEQHLGNAACLLGVDPQQLLGALTTRTRQTPEGERLEGWDPQCTGIFWYAAQSVKMSTAAD